MVDRVFENWKQYGALIIAPFSMAGLVERIERFRETNRSLLVAAIDKGFAQLTEGNGNHLSPVISVENHGEFNGELAATCLYEYCCEAPGIRRPKIVILRGREGSEARMRGFRNKLGEYKGTAFEPQVVESEAMNFTKEDGESYAARYLEVEHHARSLGSESAQVHAFFCCNDEIALGARSALFKQLKRGQLPPAPTVIVGFDGIRDVTRLLDSDEEPYLLNTIDVMVQSQVTRLVEELKRFQSLRCPSDFCCCVREPGKRYLNWAKQQGRARDIWSIHESRLAKAPPAAPITAG
jgi:ABC-type sugar transport system substrate-binding protein